MPFVLPRRMAGSALSVVIALLSLFAAGCGSVGEPLPPLLNIPERSQDLSATQTPEGIVLEWTWPANTTEGLPLKDLESFFVHAMELSANAPPGHDTFDLSSRRVGTINTAELADADLDAAATAGMPGQEAARGPSDGFGEGNDDSRTGQDGAQAPGPGRRIRHVLDISGIAGKTWAFGVSGESSRGRSSGFSNLVVIEVVSPPGTPGAPALIVESDAVVVTWTAADHADVYRILRRPRERRLFEPIGDSNTLSYRDATFEWDRHYLYRVQSLAHSATGDALGPLSEPTPVFTADTFPPAAPVRLQAIPAPGSVELSWQPSPEPDLAGYRVQRAKGDAPVSALPTGLLSTPRHSDTTVQSGQTYRYVIRAIDQDGNAGPPSTAVSVTVP